MRYAPEIAGTAIGLILSIALLMLVTCYLHARSEPIEESP